MTDIGTVDEALTEEEQRVLDSLQENPDDYKKALVHFMRSAIEDFQSDDTVTGISFVLHKEMGDGECRLYGLSLEGSDCLSHITFLQDAAGAHIRALSGEPYGMVNTYLEKWILEEIKSGRLQLENTSFEGKPS